MIATVSIMLILILILCGYTLVKLRNMDYDPDGILDISYLGWLFKYNDFENVFSQSKGSQKQDSEKED